MIELLQTRSPKLIGLRCTGRLHSKDYRKIQPKLEKTIKKEGTIRLLAQLDDFHGWDMLAAVDELMLEVKHAHDFEKIAIIGDRRWEKWMAELPKLFTTARVRYFDVSEREQAWNWLEDNSFLSFH